MAKGKSRKQPSKVWVCQVCGKMSNDRYGNDPIDRGWDVSCSINAVEVPDPRPKMSLPNIQTTHNVRIPTPSLGVPSLSAEQLDSVLR